MTKSSNLNYITDLSNVNPSELSVKDLYEYVDIVVHLANNVDLMEDDQLNVFPQRDIEAKLRQCFAALVERYHAEQDINEQLRLLHATTAIAHSVLIVESDSLVTENDNILDQAFIRLGVYDSDDVLNRKASEMQFDKNLLTTLLQSQTQNWPEDQ